MRVPAFSLIVASVLLATPAFAQSSSVTTSSERASNLPPDTMVTLDTQFPVGTAIADRPPDRSGRAQLRHPAPTDGI
jgi:hypothetical protein